MNFANKVLPLILLLGFLTNLSSQTNLPPELFADVREAYCPLNQIKIGSNFTITGPVTHFQTPSVSSSLPPIQPVPVICSADI